jgi:HPr kinase/phosphorylase
MTRPFPTIHACALKLGDAGLLIRGPSGSGKSSLTLALLALAEAQGRYARLVADDRVGLSVAEGSLLAAPHPRIAGRIERRGMGILTLPHEPSVRLTHVIDLIGGSMPNEESAGRIVLEGVELTHFRLPASEAADTLARRLLPKI